MLRLLRRLYRTALFIERYTRPKTHNLVDWEGVVKSEVEEIAILQNLTSHGTYSIKVEFENGPPDLERIGTALLLQGVIALSSSGVDPITIDTVVSRAMELGLKSTKWDRFRA